MLPVGELDDDPLSRPAVFDNLQFATVYQEAAAERLQRGIDLQQVFDDLRSRRDLAHILQMA